jgi:hypothetical protein
MVVLTCVVGIGGLSSCDSPVDPDDELGAVFRVSACESQAFNVRITDPNVISRAQSLIGTSEQPILSGALRRGNGGFNSPWSWHLDPASIEFADFTIEVCDGCPSMVEGDLDYWVDTVGRFCPWTSRITGQVR